MSSDAAVLQLAQRVRDLEAALAEKAAHIGHLSRSLAGREEDARVATEQARRDHAALEVEVARAAALREERGTYQQRAETAEARQRAADTSAADARAQADAYRSALLEEEARGRELASKFEAVRAALAEVQKIVRTVQP